MKLLYLCNNDGSDPRINKEVKTLSKKFEIDYVGMKSSEGNCFVAHNVKNLHIIAADRRSVLGLFRYFILVLRLLSTHRYHTIHIINEPLLILCYPLLMYYRRHLVLDIFDSIFLRKNKSGDRWLFLKKVLYTLPHYIIVTDDQRKNLLPEFARNKTIVLPNYPNKFEPVIKKNKSDKNQPLTIIYYGWFGKNRGTELALKLLNHSENIEIIVAGWSGDTESDRLLKQSRIQNYGVLTQDEAINLAAQKADYILCVYNPVNENNIYASPNKIFDSIQAGVPVIINREVNVSTWVERNRLGYVIESISDINIDSLVSDLLKYRGTYEYCEKLKEAFVWEKIESRLLMAHNHEDIDL